MKKLTPNHLTEDQYYALMCENMGEGFDEIHQSWLSCFAHFLKRLKVGYTDSVIQSLFYDWDMENWKAMHKENSEYARHSKDQLAESFILELDYISDHMSYDRLFRSHWLFRKAYIDEFNIIRYPKIYSKA